MLEFGKINKLGDDLVYYVPQTSVKEDLLQWYNDSLQFPYFGYNWDSLYDLLCDLHWIRERHVWLRHEEVPNLDKQELAIYLETISSAADSWQMDDRHVLHVSFPEIYNGKLDNTEQSTKR